MTDKTPRVERVTGMQETRFYLRGKGSEDEDEFLIGTRSWTSFEWAMEPAEYARLVLSCNATPQECPTCHQVFPDPEFIIEDEDGGLYTSAEFAKVLAECGVQVAESVGT